MGPRSADLSAEAAAQIERISAQPSSGDLGVVVSPWLRRGPTAAPPWLEGDDSLVEVREIVRPSTAGLEPVMRGSTIVITAKDEATARHDSTIAGFGVACRKVVAAARPGQTIVLGTPLYIGATRDFLIRPLEERGLVVGADLHVAFWPLRTGPGRSGRRPRLVGGATVDCALAAVAALSASGPAEVVSAPEMAEASALARYPGSRLGARVKRGFDITAAAIGLTVILPLIALVAVAIRLDDRGPILFTQERIGLNGRSFWIRKFRTMVDGAEGRLDEVSGLNGIRGPAFQIERDPRLTRIGSFLRRSSIDELPQLWNVLRGDMSLVGPRPAPPVEVALYEPWHRTRLAMRPGITGLAQVRARSYVDFDEKANLDLEYIARWSPLLDMEIILRTIPVVLRLSGR